MEPPSLAKELRKLFLWLTLACFSKNLDRKRDHWHGRARFLSKTIENGRGFKQTWAWLRNFRVHTCNRTPLQDILHPPLILLNKPCFNSQVDTSEFEKAAVGSKWPTKRKKLQFDQSGQPSAKSCSWIKVANQTHKAAVGSKWPTKFNVISYCRDCIFSRQN